MMKLAFVAAAALAVLTTAPLTIPVKAQGVDVQLGRDRDDGYRHRRDGVPNKLTRIIKEAILLAGEAQGNKLARANEEVPEGLVSYF
jgi:hypothetical protein